MTTRTHTPGPWRYTRFNAYSIVAETGEPIANTLEWVVGDNAEHVEHTANARLIAAAPDGLKAAQDAYTWLLENVRYPENTALRLKAQGLLTTLRNYIASATGQAEVDVQDSAESAALDKVQASV